MAISILPVVLLHRGLVPSLVLLAAVGLVRAEDGEVLPRLAPTVGEYLKSDYYDQTRFHPRIMVERALRALETSEVSIDTAWKDDVITLTMTTVVKQIPAKEPKDIDEAMALVEVVRLALDAAPGLTKERKRDLGYALVNGTLAALDPHTVLMPPEPAREFSEDIRGEFYGIGAFLNQDEGVITIERVMPGLPAEKADVQDGDIILGIDGEKTAGLSLEQAVRRIKGPKGTTVTLTVERKSSPTPVDIPVTRDLVQVITMRAKRVGDVGYVRMDEFNANTFRSLCKDILDLQKPGPMKAFVLDLRFNGGGLLDQARLISDIFLPKGEEIVRTVTADGQPQIYKSSARQLLDVPMAILTSGGSASAAEILSGALQRDERAVIVGSTTFGKGSVQTIKDLGDGSRLKLTIQEYQLPGGVSIQDVGVTPDLRLIQHTVRKDGVIDLVPFTNQREEDDEFALVNTHLYEHSAALELGWLSHFQERETLKKSAISARDFVPDQEASLVVDLVGQAVAGGDEVVAAAEQASKVRGLRKFLIDQLKAPVGARAEIESTALATALAGRAPAVAWGPATPVPAGALTLTYSGPAAVTAGETASLTFQIANAAGVDLGRLYGVVKADKFSPLWEDEVVIGMVPPKGSATGTLSFKVPPRLYGGEERFNLELYQDGRSERLASVPVRVQIQPVARPRFSYTWRLEEPGGDGQLNPGEAAALQLTLKNDGEGASAKIDLRVFKEGEDHFVQLSDTRSKLEPLAKDGTATVKIPLTVKKEWLRSDKTVMPFTGDAIKLLVRAEERFEEGIDGRYRATMFNTLTIPVNAPVVPHAIAQPAMVLVASTVGADNAATVTVKVVDPGLKFLTVFQDEDKTALLPAAKLGADGLFTTTLTLKPGANSVRIVAIDQDDVDEVLPLRLWGEGTRPEKAKPEKTAAKPEAKMKAQVDASPVIP